MGKKTTSVSAKAAFKVYDSEGRALKNKIKKLQAHVRKFPNDKQAMKSLADPTSFQFKWSTSKSEQFNYKPKQKAAQETKKVFKKTRG